MTTRWQRDLRRFLAAAARPYGATVRIEPTNGHFRATFEAEAGRRFITISASPSDRAANRKVAADAKRALRKLTSEATS
jgi:hypothetical protein